MVIDRNNLSLFGRHEYLKIIEISTKKLRLEHKRKRANSLRHGIEQVANTLVVPFSAATNFL